MGLIDMLFGTSWTDDLHSWPKGSDGKYLTAKGETKVFLAPSHAVDNIESTFEEILTFVEKKREGVVLSEEEKANFANIMSEYEASLQTLSFSHRDMALRKGTFGRLIELVDEHVKKVPELLEDDGLVLYMRHLHETLQSSDEEEFRTLASELQKRIKRLSGE